MIERYWDFDMSKTSPAVVLRRVEELQKRHGKRLFFTGNPGGLDERNITLQTSTLSIARREGWCLAGKTWLRKLKNLRY